MSEIITYKPKIKVLNKTIETKPYRLDQYVIHCEGSHDLDVPADTFQISLLPSATEQTPSYTSLKLLSFWRKTIKKGDIISIGIEEEDSHLFRIDTIQLTRKLIERNATEILTIAGRSLASLLIDDDITFAPELATDTRAMQLLGEARVNFFGLLRGYMTTQDGNEFVNQNPLAAILWIMLSMPSIHTDIAYIDYSKDGDINDSKLSEIEDKDHQKIGRFFKFKLFSYANDKVYDHQLNQFSGKAWNYITQCLDPMFYEIFVDTIKDEQRKPRPCLFINPKPYDRHTDLNFGKDKIINPSLGDFTITPIPKEFRGLKSFIYEVSLPDEKINSLPGITLSWDAYSSYSSSLSLNSKYLTRITNQEYHTVDPTEDYGGTIGTTTTDIVNFITMHATKEVLWNTELARYGYMFPLIDTFSVLRFGVRKLEGKSNMLKIESTPKAITPEQQEEYNLKYNGLVYPFTQSVQLRERLFSWYRFNPILYEGENTVLGHDYYRKGDKIFFPGHLSETGEIGMYYRIQAHRWSWSINENGCQYLSTLKLIRGENLKDIENYRKGTGYSLYDINKKDKKNPVIKIDVVMDYKNEAAGEKKESKETTLPKNETNIPEEDPTNPEKKRKVTIGDLTNASIAALETKFSNHKEIKEKFRESASAYSIDVNVLVGLIGAESDFDPNASSTSHCLGLGQFSRATARRMSNFKGGVIKEGNPSNDIRRDAFKSIMAVGELLYTNGYGRNAVFAIMSYGDNKQLNFFDYVANHVDKYKPGTFDKNDKQYARLHYPKLVKCSYTECEGCTKNKNQAFTRCTWGTKE